MVASFNDRFEVTWEDPEDADSVWAIDRIHFAQPVAPLGEDLYSVIVGRSWGTRVAFANGYLFMKDFAAPPTPDEVFEVGAIPIWHDTYLPRVKELCAGIRARDYDALPLTELVRALPDLLADAAEAFRLPTVVASEFMAPALGLALFCDRELGEDGAVLAATLLQGFANASAAAGEGLGELAEYASRHPELAGALKAERFSELDSLPGGREFLRKLQAYLDTYGWRANEWCLVHLPTWAEDTATPLRLIARYLADPAHSPHLSHQRSAELREQATRTLDARLSGDNREQFKGMLEAAMAHVPISEERALWQLIAVGSVRVPLLALGRKLVQAGVIAQPDDVFFLCMPELEQLAASPRRMQDVVGQRKSDLERYQRMEPPQSIGRPFVIDDRSPQSQIIHRYFFGTIAPPSEEKIIRGSGASQGLVTGRARIVRALSEGSRLQPGEVLVCKTTAPPWTPLFAIAAGVVTETGGILSHSAICAREYAIPCVVGTQVATSRIPDGALVTVDGTKGTVTIEL